MVDESIAHGGFVDIAGLGIAYLERLIWPVPIYSLFQFVMERKNVVHQRVLKFLHIGLLALPTDELPPCAEQILDGNDIVVAMGELNPLMRNPPPCRSSAAPFGAHQVCLSSLA